MTGRHAGRPLRRIAHRSGRHRKLPAWQKPKHWWMPWRRRALYREWNRQSSIVAQLEREMRHDLIALGSRPPRVTMEELMSGRTERELADHPRFGQYWREWHCEPPSPEQLWHPVWEEWSGPGEDGLLTRHIYQIEIADGRPGNPEHDRRDADRDGPAGPGPGHAAGGPAAPAPESAAPEG